MQRPVRLPVEPTLAAIKQVLEGIEEHRSNVAVLNVLLNVLRVVVRGARYVMKSVACREPTCSFPLTMRLRRTNMGHSEPFASTKSTAETQYTTTDLLL